jgi:very-short-patch-repair endonuclease
MSQIKSNDWVELGKFSGLDKRKFISRFNARAKRTPSIEMIFSKDLSEKFAGLRDFYRMANKQIFAAGRSEWGIDAYEVDWVRIFTPIEYGLWYDIRDCNAVLYPQYPIGRYFADFANPVAKVAIECDGKEFHKNVEKDSKRQSEIESMGWHVYRIAGRDCFTDFNYEQNESGTARKFIDWICSHHGLQRGVCT